MTTTNFDTITHMWPTLAPILFVPHTEADYHRLVSILDRLIDLVGENESHPLAPYMEVISVLIEKYEDDTVPEITSA
jgi:HTH-type transcriptional regulator / antitoxin HigA